VSVVGVGTGAAGGRRTAGMRGSVFWRLMTIALLSASSSGRFTSSMAGAARPKRLGLADLRVRCVRAEAVACVCMPPPPQHQHVSVVQHAPGRTFSACQGFGICVHPLTPPYL
jgi:hypothetical protein